MTDRFNCGTRAGATGIREGSKGTLGFFLVSPRVCPYRQTFAYSLIFAL
nr:MAG TPA: hypothetical protein [Caudoviricetes sp.]